MISTRHVYTEFVFNIESLIRVIFQTIIGTLIFESKTIFTQGTFGHLKITVAKCRDSIPTFGNAYKKFRFEHRILLKYLIKINMID